MSPQTQHEKTESASASVWSRGKLCRTQFPPSLDCAKEAKEAAIQYTKDQSPILLNLRFDRTEFFKNSWLGDDLSRWPIWPTSNDKTHFTPRYIGLILNLISLMLLAAMVMVSCEYRIRRVGSLLRYSLANLLIFFVPLSAVCVAWVAYLQQETATQEKLSDSLQEIYGEVSDTSLMAFEVNHESRFPLVVSQLFNHGRHPR